MTTLRSLVRTGILVAGLAVLAAPALPSPAGVPPYDGAPDPTLNPPGGAPPFWAAIPGLFDFGVDLGGGAPFSDVDTAAAVAVQTDGKIVVAGYSWNTSNGNDQNACVLIRFNADGTVDSGFGSSGRIVVNMGGSGQTDCYFNAIALQGDGRIVVAGNTNNASFEQGFVGRYNADGTPDNTFNNGGTGNYAFAGTHSSFNAIVIDTDGTIITAGRAYQNGHSDNDFFYERWAGNNGNAIDWNWAAFNLGGDDDDRAAAVVLQKDVCVTLPCFLHDELYLVGFANNVPYADGLNNHDCAIVAYSRAPGDSAFSLDTGFNGTGSETIDFPMAPDNEGDNICRAAVAQSPYVGGLVIGGENYFFSTLGGNPQGLASYYALATVAATGTVTREDLLANYYEVAFPGIFNGISAMAWQADGKLLIAGYAGTDAPSNAPSDMGLARYNPDFSFDSSFGPQSSGKETLSLDGQDGAFAAQQEWTNAMAIDNRGHIVVAGPRSWDVQSGNDYDWMVGRLSTFDEIFRDGFDGTVPPGSPKGP